MSEQDVEEAVIDEAVVDEVEVDQVDQPDQDESVARERGWKPRDEWKGDVPATFIDDPRDFNEFYERSNPRLKSEVEELRNQLAAFEGWKEKQERMYQDRLAKELDSLGAALQEATSKGDYREVNNIISRRDELRDEIGGKAEKSNEPDPSFSQWVQENAWYDQTSPAFDRKRALFAEGVGAELQQRNPTLKGIPFLNAVKRAVEEEFGVSKPKDATPPKVEGVRRAGARGKKEISEWGQLPDRVQRDPNVNRIVKKMYDGDKNKYARDWAAMNQEN